LSHGAGRWLLSTAAVVGVTCAFVRLSRPSERASIKVALAEEPYMTRSALLRNKVAEARSRIGRPHPVQKCEGSTRLEQFMSRSDPSWVGHLAPDPEQQEHAPNKRMRPVRSGHYVEVQPTALRSPFLIAASGSMLSELGLTHEDAQDERFVRFFAGDMTALPKFTTSWGTPYALSINGQEMSHQCPFGTGEGYGDGRAISVADVVNEAGQRWEMQLKGAGRTPWCRGADGRAVLRSSIREFLASECMHNLGVSTTRPLSLIVSREDRVERGWFSGRASSMDIMKREPCAISCRCAPSFVRVGHLELFARRARSAAKDSDEYLELELMVEHAIYREYPEVNKPGADLQTRILEMLDKAGRNMAELMINWLRVGYCQGNFNGDNCLIGGRTMDYGPFGFMERYDPSWCMWEGGGQHFSFAGQPRAGLVNFMMMVRSTLPLLDEQGEAEAQKVAERTVEYLNKRMAEMWASKCGLQGEAGCDHAMKLLKILERAEVDFTIFFRQMAALVEGELGSDGVPPELEPAFYSASAAAVVSDLKEWLQEWWKLLPEDRSRVAADMRAVNPKYVPREWMLVEAYNAAGQGDFEGVHQLLRLFQEPYAEQPDWEERYYRRAPDAVRGKPGVVYMS